jgi:two-component system, OmpR family, response regulator
MIYTPMNDKQTILLLNNDEVTENPLLSTLCQQGYAVLTAHSSCQALSTLSEVMVDLVIIDSEIADMKGVDFLHQLRQQHCYTQLPVLMLLEEELVASPVADYR